MTRIDSALEYKSTPGHFGHLILLAFYILLLLLAQEVEFFSTLVDA